MSTELRVTSIPTLVTTAAATSLRGVFAPLVSSPAPAGRQPSLADADLPRLTFTVTARRVRGVPLSLPAGRYHLTVVDDRPVETTTGAVMLLQLPDGMTLERALTSAEDADAPPEFFFDSRMPGGAEFGADGTSVSVVDLTPGEWIVAGYAMTTEPTTMMITGTLPANLPEPVANVAVTLHDGAMKISEGMFRSGRNIIRIDNAGTEPHFLTIDRVPHGTTVANIRATIQEGLGERPVARPVDRAEIEHITASADQSAGTTMWLSIDLEPGIYAAVGDQPETGMYTVFTVA